MRILFCKPKYVGDALILTPTLTAVRAAYPQAEIWVLVRKGSEGILRGCPAIDQVVTVAAAPPGEPRNSLDIIADVVLIHRLRRQSFDILIELGDGHRARWISLLCGAAKNYSVKTRSPLNGFWTRWFDGIARFDARDRHRVETDYRSVGEFLPLPDVLPPPLMFERSQTEPWEPGSPLTTFAVLHPGTRDRGKRWPPERWAEVGRSLLERFEHVVISAGPLPQERDDAAWIAQALGSRALNMGGTTRLPQLAGLLYRAALFVGVDTAAMHLAAACQTPTVALFGPSREREWHPWRVRHRVVISGIGLPAEDVGGSGTLRAMVDIAAPAVIAACDDLLSERAAERGIAASG